MIMGRRLRAGKEADHGDYKMRSLGPRILTMSSFVRSPLLAVALLLAMLPVLTGCAADTKIPTSAATPSPQLSCLRGEVVFGPTCPAERSDAECSDRPFAAELIIQTEDGDEVTRINTGDDGQFQAELAPGEYVLVPVEPNPGAPPTAKPIDFSVESGDCAELRIRYDSGIRGPGSSKQEP